METFTERMARERAELETKYRELYAGVAPHLPGWSVITRGEDETMPCYQQALTDGQRKLELTFVKDRVAITGWWPKDNKGRSQSPRDIGAETPMVTVAANRGHEAIATSILARFLPDYLRIWGKLAEVAHKADAFAEGVEAVKALLIATGKCKQPDYSECLWCNSGKVQVNSPTSVTLELRSIGPETAAKILALL